MARIMVSRKGQLILPMSIRRQVGLEAGGLVDVYLDQGRVVLEAVADPSWNWLKMRGALKGTHALQDHLAEHQQEVQGNTAGG